MLTKFEDKHNEDYQGTESPKKLSKKAQLNIITSLYDFIKNLKLREHSEWGNYYDKTNYAKDAFHFKAELISSWVSKLKPKTLIDIGGNDGTFVRRIQYKLESAIVCDVDNNAVDYNFKTVKTNKDYHIIPMVLDVLNPSASIGFNNTERKSFLKRIQHLSPDVTLALALIHHITLSGNVTFNMSANFFASFSNHLIIEFPNREDSWVQRLLNTKGEFKSHFNFYTEENFELAYLQRFTIIEKVSIPNTKRTMYFLKLK